MAIDLQLIFNNSLTQNQIHPRYCGTSYQNEVGLPSAFNRLVSTYL